MTITYSGKFHVLLFRWKASLWKSVWMPLAVYLILFYAIGLLYRYAMSTNQQAEFSALVVWLDEAVTGKIPIAFLLGLYVVTIVKRWWEQFENIAWPDHLMTLVAAHIQNVSDEEEARMVRRTMARYAVLSAALAWRNLSSRVLKRFPTADHLVQAGLMSAAEASRYQATEAPFGRWFLPLFWLQQHVVRWRERGLLQHSQANQLLQALASYKAKFVRLFVFDWVSIPLVYTQVCTVATLGYFGLCLLSRQPVGEGLHRYFPVITVLQFLFYFGWLKVAEKMMHPFGEEDDDFELNFLLDRHLYVALMTVDGLEGREPPPLHKDIFWDRSPVLPHTKASGRIREWRPQSKGIAKALPFQEMELDKEEAEEETKLNRRKSFFRDIIANVYPPNSSDPHISSPS